MRGTSEINFNKDQRCKTREGQSQRTHRVLALDRRLHLRSERCSDYA